MHMMNRVRIHVTLHGEGVGQKRWTGEKWADYLSTKWHLHFGGVGNSSGACTWRASPSILLSAGCSGPSLTDPSMFSPLSGISDGRPQNYYHPHSLRVDQGH